MGNVFKKTVTRPLPPDPEIITRQGRDSLDGAMARAR
jgi:hypothetical protein